MTVRHLFRRAWLAALLGCSGIAAAQDAPLPPLPGATPAVPAPVTPAAATTPSVPPPGILPALATGGQAEPVEAPPERPMPPATPLPMMAPMPSAAPALPPMNIPDDVKTAAAKSTAPSTTPAAETVAAAKAESTSRVTVGKPPIDGLAAYGMMLAEAKIAYAKIADYSGHVIHRDRVQGKMTPDQTAEIRVRNKPASIALKYVAPNPLLGLELVHVAGQNAGKIRMKPAGTFSANDFQTVESSDSRATAHSRHTVAEFGIGPMIETLEKHLSIERRLKNAVQVSVSEYSYDKRPVTRYEVFTDRAHALRYAYRTVVYVDKDTKLPIRMEAYGQPVIGGPPTGELMESYSYVNLKFNQGLGESVFEK